jgi:tetratricopeptide (TPR) repeat protein
VTDGKYTLAELTFAQHRWPHPHGNVLPVVVSPTPFDQIPEYLKAVTVLQPRGEIAAEVVAAVDRMARPWYWRWRRRLVLAALLLALAAGAAWVASTRRQERAARETAIAADIQAARMHEASGNYAAAWKALESARTAYPDAPGVVGAQQRLAMAWLQNIRGSQLTGNFRDIVDKVTPVVAEGAAGTGTLSADLRAHLGWAEFLRSREGATGLNPRAHYAAAIALDPGNVYAHAMLGFDLLAAPGASRAVAALPEAREHFATALRSGRERPWVRRMQISAASWYPHPALELEAVRIASDIRRAGEDPPEIGGRPLAAQLWTIYVARLMRADEPAAFLAGLEPADHLATFRWLYPAETYDGPRVPYLAVLGPLQEHAGDRAAALATARELLERLTKNGDGGNPIAVRARAAIARLRER